MVEPLEPFMKLKLQSVSFAVPSVLVMINGILIIKLFDLKAPEKSKVSPDFNAEVFTLPEPLKYVE